METYMTFKICIAVDLEKHAPPRNTELIVSIRMARIEDQHILTMKSRDHDNNQSVTE